MTYLKKVKLCLNKCKRRIKRWTGNFEIEGDWTMYSLESFNVVVVKYFC